MPTIKPKPRKVSKTGTPNAYQPPQKESLWQKFANKFIKMEKIGK